MSLNDKQKNAIAKVESLIAATDEAVYEAADVFPQSVYLLWKQCSIEVCNGGFWIEKVVERMEEEANAE